MVPAVVTVKPSIDDEKDEAVNPSAPAYQVTSGSSPSRPAKALAHFSVQPRTRA